MTTQQDGENHEVIPYHQPIKIRTLSGILVMFVLQATMSFAGSACSFTWSEAPCGSGPSLSLVAASCHQSPGRKGDSVPPGSGDARSVLTGPIFAQDLGSAAHTYAVGVVPLGFRSTGHVDGKVSSARPGHRQT